MSNVKRAFLSMLHYWKWNVLLFFVYLIVSALLLSAYIIRPAAEQSIKQVKKSIGASVLVSITDADFDPLTKENYFSYDTGKKIGSLSQVRQSSYITTANAYGARMEGIKSSVKDEFGTFLITGATDMKEHWNFQQKNYVLLEGRFLTAEDEGRPYAVISKQVEEQNGLHIGDKFKVRSYFDKNVTVELEIIGIHSGSGPVWSPNFMSACNNIYTPVDTAVKLNGEGVMEAEYRLYDPDDMAKFLKQAGQIAQADAARLSFDEKNLEFLLASTSLNGLIKLCNAILLSTVIMAVFILSLLVIYSLIGRFYEVGVLLSMGETKAGIILQMNIEMLMPMLFAITVSIFVSRLVARQLVDTFLKNVNAVQEVEVFISNKVIVLVYAIGLSLVFVSTLIPMLSILRYKPKEVFDRFQ